MIYSFVENPCPIEKLNDSRIMIAYNAAKNGDLKPLKEMYKKDCMFGREHLLKGSYKLLGWHFNLFAFCKTYLVHQKHYGWIEYTVPNKTCLYNLIGKHNVLEIIEKA